MLGAISRWMWRTKGVPPLVLVSLAAAVLLFGFIAFADRDDPSRSLFRAAQVIVLNSGHEPLVEVDPAKPDPATTQDARAKTGAAGGAGAAAPRFPVERAALVVARVAALAFALLGALQIVLQFRPWITNQYLRRITGHAVVIGLGRVGMQLVRDLRRQGRDVVAVDVDASNAHLNEAADTGAVVVDGDGSDEGLLDRLRLTHARDVFVTTGSQLLNLELGLAAQKRRAAVRRADGASTSTTTTAPPLSVYMHLHDAEMADLAVRGGHRRTEGEGAATVRRYAFDATANSARRLVTKFAAHAPAESQPFQLILVGFGRLGQEIAFAAGCLCHFGNGLRPRVVVAERHAAAARDAFVDRYPAFAPRGASPVVTGPATARDRWGPAAGERAGTPLPQDLAVRYVTECAGFLEFDPAHGFGPPLEALVATATDPHARTIIVVATPDPATNLVVSLRLRERITESFALRDNGGGESGPIPIFAYLPERSRLADLMADEQDRRVPVFAFGQREENCGHHCIVRDAEDRAARRAFVHYVRQSRPDAAAVTDAEVERAWEDTDWWQRFSNRMAVSHVPFKLATLGLDPPTDPDDPASFRATPRQVAAALDASRVERLARQEHNRWMAERLLTGWAFGPQRDEVRRQRPSLCHWDDMVYLKPPVSARDEWRKDLAQVANLPAMLHALRGDPPPPPPPVRLAEDKISMNSPMKA